MIARWPGRVRAGAVEATPAISMDFAPTFLEAAGVPFEAEEFDGVSLLPLAARGEALARDAIFLHYPHYAYHGRNHMGSVIRRGDLKYPPLRRRRAQASTSRRTLASSSLATAASGRAALRNS